MKLLNQEEKVELLTSFENAEFWKPYARDNPFDKFLLYIAEYIDSKAFSILSEACHSYDKWAEKMYIASPDRFSRDRTIYSPSSSKEVRDLAKEIYEGYHSKISAESLKN